MRMSSRALGTSRDIIVLAGDIADVVSAGVLLRLVDEMQHEMVFKLCTCMECLSAGMMWKRLVRVQVRFWLWNTGALPTGMVKSSEDFTGLALELSVTVIATWAVAFVSYFLIERPFARWWVQWALKGSQDQPKSRLQA